MPWRNSGIIACWRNDILRPALTAPLPRAGSSTRGPLGKRQWSEFSFVLSVQLFYASLQEGRPLWVALRTAIKDLQFLIQSSFNFRL